MSGVGCVRQKELCASALHLTQTTRQSASAAPLGAGTMGLKGDLTAGEIVEQLVHAQRVTTIKNVVFMVSNRVSCLVPSPLSLSHLSSPDFAFIYAALQRPERLALAQVHVQYQPPASLCSLSDVIRASLHAPLLQWMRVCPDSCAVCRAWESR